MSSSADAFLNKIIAEADKEGMAFKILFIYTLHYYFTCADYVGVGVCYDRE
jgi:hypothetical protein